MLEIVRQQMICIVAPGWGGGAEIPKQHHDALDALLEDVAVVHFASIGLLPALAGAPNQQPVLVLELAVEEGLRPYDLLYRLVYHPDGAMWTLFGGMVAPHVAVPTAKDKEQLLNQLMSWHSIAAGGFVGARDRSVRQIRMESDLLDQTRIEARKLKPKYSNDRTAFALALARWAYANPRFEWAVKPAPRSYWRGKGASIGAKLAYPVAAIVLWFVVLGIVWALPRAYNWFFGEPGHVGRAIEDAVTKTSECLLTMSWHGLLAFALIAFLVWLFLVPLPAQFVSWRRWLNSVQQELDRPTQTLSSLATYAGGWLIGVPLLLAVAACALAYTFAPLAYAVAPDYMVHVVEPKLPKLTGLQITGIAVVAIAAVLCIGALSYRLNRRFKKLSEQFFHPLEDDVPRAQQIHPSIERCEADLVDGTQHMFSLTELRGPQWWSAWCIRVALRIVTFAGRVFFTQGWLGNAPGIHFGHWHIIDNGRRFLFCSNYDGNFGGYLDDFINGAAVGTTLAWRWTELRPRAPALPGQPGIAKPRSFPPTRFVVFRGVKCELRFKSYARDSMLPHLYHFDACNRTVDQINLATGLRDALFGERNEKNDDLIMRAIET
ncbi:hypothetical protein [Bradyrhizobium sp. LVM 105]|uniref:hypothetical protein n=1 Tax=Bradyrhizobium sp. LVM 105 TaxID=2341115 RepID=UPI000F7FC890|nr:hypothetical protein [Bradyrhizobium sp. LVM 105]RTE91571.1 hypothetical protein D6B98_19340 [Bradyrhizobium sp. LVM 105]